MKIHTMRVIDGCDWGRMDAVVCSDTIGHTKRTWGGTGGPGRTYMVKVGVWRDSYYMGVGRGFTGEQ